MKREEMMMIAYGADGSDGFGTLFGIGKDYDEAVMNSAQYLEEGESLDDYDFFGLFITEAARKELEDNGGSNIYDERFVVVDDEVLMLVDEVTLDLLESHGGFIDQGRGRSVWVTTIGWQLKANCEDRESPGCEEWKDLPDDTIILLWDDGTWKRI